MTVMWDPDEEALLLITKLVSLINVPKTLWTGEDNQFFREVQTLIRRRNNGTTSGESGESQTERELKFND